MLSLPPSMVACRMCAVVDAEVKIGDLTDSELAVQIDTRGSDHREIEGRLSQTLQLTRGSAHQLYKILRETFGFET